MAGHAELVDAIKKHGPDATVKEISDVVSESKHGHEGPEKKIVLVFDKDKHEHAFYSYDGSDVQFFSNVQNKTIVAGDDAIVLDLGGYCGAILVGT